MTTYAVTGATGHLGVLTIEALLDRGVPASDIVAVVRDPGRAATVADRGVTVRTADYSRPETLPAALAQVDVLLLVSGNELGQRLTQHTAVVDAAKAAGVTRIVYTSLLRADTSRLALAPEHKATEDLLRSSGTAFTILRNSWYIENYTSQLDGYLARGAIAAAAGDGRISGATRADFAAAAAAVLTGSGHENAVYELGGPAFTLKELAAVITEVSGTDVVYQDLSVAELTAVLTGAGLDEGTAAFVAGLDDAIAHGDLDDAGDDLTRLIGRPTTPLGDAVRAAL